MWREYYLYFYYLFNNERRTMRPILVLLALLLPLLFFGALSLFGAYLAFTYLFQAANSSTMDWLFFSLSILSMVAFHVFLWRFFINNAFALAFPRSFYIAQIIIKENKTWSEYFMKNG